MTQKDIEKTLYSRLEEYLAVYPIDVSYPNISYSTSSGINYLKIDFIHGETSAVELGTDSDDRAVGIMQITVTVASDGGSSESSSTIGQLKEYFKRATVASYNGLNVRITKFYLGSDSEEEDWYREVVNVVFRSDISN